MIEFDEFPLSTEFLCGAPTGVAIVENGYPVDSGDHRLVLMRRDAFSASSQ
jgi:hypothetical protein